MQKFLITRNIPGVGSFTPAQIRDVARESCRVLRELGTQIQWMESYVTADTMTCVYLASDAELVYEHARRGNFPADKVESISYIVDSSTADGSVWMDAGGRLAAA